MRYGCWGRLIWVPIRFKFREVRVSLFQIQVTSFSYSPPQEFDVIFGCWGGGGEGRYVGVGVGEVEVSWASCNEI